MGFGPSSPLLESMPSRPSLIAQGGRGLQGHSTHHEVSVGDVVLDHTSTQDDHPRALGEYGLHVDESQVWDRGQRSGLGLSRPSSPSLRALAPHLQRCPGPSLGFYRNGRRSCHPVSHP